MRRFAIRTAIGACLLLAAAASSSAQSSFSIDPLLIRLDADTRNAVMTITNTSPKEIRFEIKGFAWKQTPPEGAMDLTPSSDIVIFPPLVVLKPHAVQRVRVGTTAAQGPVEKAYRVMIEELPSGAAPPGAATVAVRTRIGVPVFIEPTAPQLNGRIDSIRFEKRLASITLANTGTIHAMVDSVVLRGMSAPDEVMFEESLGGWYVLASQTRVWKYNLKAAQCHGLKFVEVEVYAHERVLTSRADVPAEACSP
jgi:fimbrial chaperone protein